MFIDHAEIHVRGGEGGDGCVAFLRERFRPHGGPSGGNGGSGGSVYAVASEGVDTLLDFSRQHHWHAENGRPGEGDQRAGRRGVDLTIELPPGTLIHDRDNGVLLRDLTTPGDRVCLAAGGAGGRGNKSFATPTEQTPRQAEQGEPGEERHLRLELKLIADVGLVGLPNAGKSTLLAALSKATPKIAPYPFTTIRPQLGIAELGGFRRLVLADIPGLIEGAHEGSGLGDAFLRHIERTRVIAHLIDLVPPDGAPAPEQAYCMIRAELAKFSRTLADKPELIVANKIDLDADHRAVEKLRRALNRPVSAVSAATRSGVGALSESMWKLVGHQRPRTPARRVATRTPPHLRTGS